MGGRVRRGAAARAARHGCAAGIPGRAVQVDPSKPTLTAPGTKRLKLKCDEPLSNFAFKCNLRHYILDDRAAAAEEVAAAEAADPYGAALRYGLEAGAYTRPLLGST